RCLGPRISSNAGHKTCPPRRTLRKHFHNGRPQIGKLLLMLKIQSIENTPLPDVIRDEAHLEELLSTPSRGLVNDLGKLDGDILILGVAGKVGPTLAMMARRAAPHKRIIGVARFSDADVRRRLNDAGV